MNTNKERYKELKTMLHNDLSDVEKSIVSLKLTLVERETERLKIIDAIDDVESLLEECVEK